MRHIQQTATCKRLQRRRHNPPNSDQSAKKAWRRFNKKDVRKACYKQQFGLCAYTELSLDDPEIGSHLEHIAPKSRYPARTFEPGNIVLCAMDAIYAGRLAETERFGGHYKLDQYTDESFISPFQQDCERYFYYCDASGQVLAGADLTAEQQAKATHTIALLNLNCAFLVSRRLACLTAVKQQLSLWQSHNQTPTEAESQALITDRLAVQHGRLPEFYSAIKQYLVRL